MLYYSHMAGFGEKLSAIKGKQEAADQMKKEQAEKAAEAARLEREAKRSELSAERDTVTAEFAQAEQTANEAREAIAQADAFAEQQGENLDPEAKAEIDAMKVEAGEAQQKFEELKTRLDGLNAEISAFEGSEESQETSTEATAEVVQGEEPATEATPQVEVEQAPDTTTEKSVEVDVEKQKKAEAVERSLETAEGHFQKLEQDLEQAEATIKAVEGMEAGSREKYDAAFEMRSKVEEIFFADATVDAVLRYTDTSSDNEGAQKIEVAKQKLDELKSKYEKTLQEMMVTWWNAKGQHEGGKSAEIAKDYTEIVRTDITPNQAEQMLSSKELDEGGKEYVATELMKKFMDSGKEEDAVNIAALARKNGFYKSMNIDSLNADLVKSIKYKNPNLYQRAKALLGPNTQPYV